MNMEPTFKERKTSDIRLGFNKISNRNGKEIMDFMRKNVEQIREHYARKRAELYEEEGFLIHLLVSEFNNKKNQIS